MDATASLLPNDKGIIRRLILLMLDVGLAATVALNLGLNEAAVYRCVQTSVRLELAEHLQDEQSGCYILLTRLN